MSEVIIVLGMHRSGTSVLSRSLNIFGFKHGNKSQEENYDNPKGFFEDSDIRELNDKILKKLNINWNLFFPTVRHSFSKNDFIEYTEEAVLLLQRKINLNPFFIIKDPRMCRLLFFWKNVFKILKIKTFYAFSIRDPINIALSLKKRNNFYPEQAFMLWFEHLLFAVNDTLEEQTVFIEYDKILDFPKKEIERIGTILNIKNRINNLELKNFTNNFLDRNLNNHRLIKKNNNNLPLKYLKFYKNLLEYCSLKSYQKSSISIQFFKDLYQSYINEDHIFFSFFNNITQVTQAKEQEIVNLTQVTQAKEQEIVNLTQVTQAKEQEIVNLTQVTQAKEQEIVNLNQAVTERDAHIQNLNNSINEIRSSTSWRVSAPVRWIGGGIKMIKNLCGFPIFVIKRCDGPKKTIKKIRLVYKTGGLSGLKNRLIEAYSSRKMLQGRSFSEKGAEHLPVMETQGSSNKENYIKQVLAIAANKSRVVLDFVPRVETNFDLSNCPIKAIAFYLPQFHPVPENDEWWGKGFTEWTNVSKAMPQFVGHYQPHLPGELGFYDLRLVDVQRQQIELAKQYGIQGFCYHYYWFSGKRLLERPLQQILANPDLDLPFCLCWANENWSRRWDGQEQDILMAQNYSPEDDLAFIADIAPALQDRRYIRFNGRPILIVYRASLLPDARATAQRWREYCRDEGIGELYLVAARSFGFEDPRPCGFDASIEFPPHEANGRILNRDIAFSNPDFEGNVYSYEDMIASYLAIDSNAYPIIKTVCPSWDNEARKPGKGHIFFGSSPEAYGRWLRGACDWTLEKCTSNSKHPPFVFVNAWNEWAEGAHLEPDRKYGYANLHVTANTLQSITPRSSDIQTEITDSQSRFRRASDGAVIIHLFYGDLLDEILPYLENTKKMDLFVSLGPNVSIDNIRHLRKTFPNCYIDAYPNRGRDLLPFINLLEVVKNYGYVYGCKLHTKKSPQRNDGNQLRRDLFESLIGTKKRVQKFMQMFEDDYELGLAAPPKLFLDLSEPNRNVLNRSWLDRLLSKLEREDLIGTYSWQFVAGAMFWFRVDAFSWLLSLGLPADDFEYELGQVDGTLAHALERFIAFGVEQAGYRISNELNQGEK